ncbi:type II secretion system secretin GspD [Pseudorhodoferax sp.]|uniref:type II secretion system secretin GspD n=1 Tax=Pseudorhodoferax sp. TaxID=1993553 RepID=UPI002DD64A0B|nr:type II secretion system secretin GspD [Pseudorhodoferax sp.]
MTVYRTACASLVLAFAQLAFAQSSKSAADSGANDVASEPRAEPRILRGNDRVVGGTRSDAKLTGSPVSFSFEEAPVAEVVRTLLGDILKVDYVLHPPIAGTITLSTRKAMPPDQAVFLLESALQANGLAMMRDARGSFQIGRPETLRALGASVRIAGGEAPLQPGYGVIVVPLEYIGANEMAAILRPLMQADTVIRVDSLRNLLVLVGNRSQAEAWMELVRTFDVDMLKGMSVGLFPLKYASIADVTQALQLLGAGAAAAPSAPGAPTAPGSPQAAAAAAAAAAQAAPRASINGMQVMPIERLNSVLIVTPRAAQLDEARRWIERLDQPSDSSSEPQLFIYHVQNGSARHLASLLGGLFGDGRQSSSTTSGNPTSGVAPGLAGSTLGSSGLGNSSGNSAFGWRSGSGQSNWGQGGLGQTSALGQSQSQNPSQAGQTSTAASVGNLRVMADDVNNVVLIWGPRSEYAKIEASLKRLDVPPTQVLIEASIIEVTLDDSLRYGLQWFFKDRQRNGLSGSGGLFNADSATAGTLTGAVSQGFSYTLRSGGLGGDIRVVLNALASKSLLKVISSPSLMVQDNFTANITVGTQQPVNAGTTISGSSNIISNNIQYKDTGVNLSVTPSVNAGNMVNMVIAQAVTDLGTLDDATDQYSFLQRQLTTKVAVRSGETLVLGGLIRDNTSNGRSGIPLLQDIPVLGKLFGTTNSGTARTELLLTITPRVVRSDQELRDISGELRDRMKGLTALDPANTAGGAPWTAREPSDVIIEPIR